MNVVTGLLPGFADPVLDAQRVFRGVMEALARPGSLQPLADLPEVPAPLTPELAAIALALADADAPLWLDAPLAGAPAVAEFLRFHTGAPIVKDPAEAAFALVADQARCPPHEGFAQGTPDYPDASTTLVLALPRQEGGKLLLLEGPGIEGCRSVTPPLPEGFVARLKRNRKRFPLGLDHLLALPGAVMGLPRSTRVTEA